MLIEGILVTAMAWWVTRSYGIPVYECVSIFFVVVPALVPLAYIIIDLYTMATDLDLDTTTMRPLSPRTIATNIFITAIEFATLAALAAVDAVMLLLNILVDEVNGYGRLIQGDSWVDIWHIYV
jgi:hypothetical protein